MDDATPKNDIDISIPQTKEDRVGRLTELDSDLLQKTLTLLKQFKRSGIGTYKIKENEIQELSNGDISWALFTINPLYTDFKFDLKKHKKFITEEVFEKGKLTKVKIKAAGDIMNYPVFYLSGFDESIGNYAERTFMIGPQFELALSEIKEVLNPKSRYLLFADDVFLYNGNRLNLEANSYGYIILCNIYTILNGMSGEISYKDLIGSLSKNVKFKGLNNTKIQEKIRKYATSRTDGIGVKIKETENNGKPLIGVKYSYGIIFNNN